MFLRRTKIIATLGPQTDNPAMLKKLIENGTNLVRINLSHGSVASHIQRIHQVHAIAKELALHVGILADLQGPKIRIKHFSEGKVLLEEGHDFMLDARMTKAGDVHRVGLDYANLPKEVHAGDILLLDDGRITLKVKSTTDSEVLTEVQDGGWLSNNKGLNRKGGGLSAGALTEKDKEHIKLLASESIDYVAISFVKSAKDIQQARRWMDEYGLKADLVAKIERVEALDHIEEIIEASEAIMVARGDLGVEIGFAELPGVQKDIIHKAQSMNKLAITATQMMESMIESTIPTRAEVSDVANAILDGTDAVMLSAETATGRHPDKVIRAMNEICLSAEKRKLATRSHHRVHSYFTRQDEAIAMAAMYVANHLEVKAIVALSESGSTPLWMSRIRSSMPIYALSRHPKTCGRMTLFRGVHPVGFDATLVKSWDVTRLALDFLIEQKLLEKGDRVILTKGNIIGVDGKANTMKIVTAGEVN